MAEMEQVRAKVFMSCGQDQKSDEVQIAQKVSERLTALGYDPYVAVEQQSLRALQQNIFRELDRAEYFLFIDFKREQLNRDGKDSCRGSLFCHQEFAIASYLDLPVLAFHEEGVEERNGLAGALHLNSIRFSDRQDLPTIIAHAVRDRENWRPDWKNELTMVATEERRPAFDRAAGKPAYWFGVVVKNRNVRRPAMNCYVYLEQVDGEPRAEALPLESTELFWSGYNFPNALIGPGATRTFDAFMVYEDAPSVCIIRGHTSSDYHVTKIAGAGDYELVYAVVSENFPVARGIFNLHIGGSIKDLDLAMQ